MSKLQRFIISEWMRFFIGSVIIFILLISIANIISGLLRTNVTAVEVLLNHLIELPGNSTKIFPVSCLTATIFSINKLQSRNELVAIFASGFSRLKFVATIIFTSLLMAILQIYLSGFVHPWAKSKKNQYIAESEKKFRNLKSKAIASNTIGSGKIWFKGENYFFSFTHFDKNSFSLIDFSKYEYDENFLLKSKVFVPKLVFNPKTKKWNTTKISSFEKLNSNEFPQNLEGEGKVMNLEELPEDFSKLNEDINGLNLFKLYYHLRKISESGINIDEYLVQLFDKINSAISCVLLAVFASIAIFKPNRRQSSFGKTLSFVFVFTLLFWLLNSYFQELGNSSKVNPIVACFFISFSFIVYLTIVFFKNRKLT